MLKRQYSAFMAYHIPSHLGTVVRYPREKECTLAINPESETTVKNAFAEDDTIHTCVSGHKSTEPAIPLVKAGFIDVYSIIKDFEDYKIADLLQGKENKEWVKRCLSSLDIQTRSPIDVLS
jgi:hypothetical protein